jgi:glutamate racemase
MVKDFGAVGDGRHIDSPAINAAIEQAIRNCLGDGVLLIGAADCAAHELADYLRENDLCGTAGEARFFTSGSAEAFTAHASIFLGRPPRSAVCHVPAMEV